MPDLVVSINGTPVSPGAGCGLDLLINLLLSAGGTYIAPDDGPNPLANGQRLHFRSPNNSIIVSMASESGGYTVELSTRISSQVGNAATLGPDGGVFVPNGGTALQVQDTNTINLTLTGTGSVGDPYIISGVPIVDGDVDNLTGLTANGILTKVFTGNSLTGTGTAGSPLSVVVVDNGDGTYSIGSAVIDTRSSMRIGDGLTGTGVLGDPVRVLPDPLATNLLSVSPAGVLVTVSTDATMTGDGTPGNPLSVVPGGGSGIDTLTVVDGQRATAAANVLNIPDSTPFARIGFQDLVGRRGTAVAHAGAGNEGNAIVSYAWSGASVTFGTPAGATTTISVATPGRYTIQLVVTDSNNNTYTTSRIFAAENIVYVNPDSDEYLNIDTITAAWSHVSSQAMSPGHIVVNGTSVLSANFNPDDIVYVSGGNAGRIVGDGTLREILTGNGSPMYFRNLEISGNVRVNFDAGGEVNFDNVIWNTSGGSDGFIKSSVGTVNLSVRHSTIICSLFLEDTGANAGNTTVRLTYTTVTANTGIEADSASLLILTMLHSEIIVTSGYVAFADVCTITLHHSRVETEDISPALNLSLGTTVSVSAFHSDIISADGNAIDFGTSTTPALEAWFSSFIDRTGTQSIGRDAGSPYTPTPVTKCYFQGTPEGGFTVPGSRDNLVI